MSERHPVAILPADAPSTQTAREIADAFKDSGSENILIVVLSNPGGMTSANESVYRTLTERLRADTADVALIQDFLTTPDLKSDLVSKDGKAWILPVGLVGELGTPKAFEAYNRVSDIVARSVDGTSLQANLTGPAGTVADLTNAGASDRTPIEIAITVLLLLILGIIYRRPVTMLLPLLVIGASLLTAQAVVAAISLFTGMAISNQTIVFMSALMAGAGTDYAVFLISRFHDYVRQGSGSSADSMLAVRRGLVAIGPVIAASAATVGITFLGMGFAKLGVFSTVGVALAVGVGVAFLAAITLLPAVLTLAGRRGWVNPRKELTGTFWRRSGIRVVRRPARYLTVGLVILLALASCTALVRFNYDDRKQLPDSVPSSLGYAALEKHFPVNQSIPEYLFITSPDDLRTPRALADLEQMAQRVAQLPDVAMVRGVTRPTGESLEQARATYQAGEVGNQLNGASSLISGSGNDLNRLTSGADQLADGLGAVRGQVDGSIGSVRGLLDSLATIQSQFGGATALGDLADAAQIIRNVRSIGDLVKRIFSNLSADFSWLDPVIASLDSSPVCNSDAVCIAARGQFVRIREARDDGTLDRIISTARQLQNAGPLDKLSTTIDGLTTSLTSAYGALSKLGLTNARTARAAVGVVQKRAGDLADGSRQLANGVGLLVDQVKRVGLGLGQASSFLMSMGQNSTSPAMSGFNVPPEVLATEQFKQLARIFVSPDGHSVRYFVQTKLNPFSTEAMDQVNTILNAAKSAQPNTTLADAKISMSGYPVTLRDTRDYYDRDIRLIVTITVLVVLLILMVLLRAVVGPLYLVGSVILSYLSALGIGVLFFQELLGQQLHWSIPGLAFVVLVAVGADYNMLLASRLREESAAGVRSAVIRTVRSTGGVITAAGLIFAASMFGLLFASIGVVVQGGFVIGVGILVDTFLVRTITVPAIAALVGKATWWPSEAWSRRRSRDDGGSTDQQTVFDAVDQS